MSRAGACGATLLVLSILLAASCRPTDRALSPERSAMLVLQHRLDPTGAPPLTTVKGLSATSRYVYVGQQDEQHLLMFTPEGRFVKTIGRAGGGPGEFRDLMRFGLLADTLWVTDWELRRFTFFTDTGGVLGTLAFEPEVVAGGSGDRLYQWLPQTLAPGGWLLGFGGQSGAWPLIEGRIDRFPLLRSTRRGTGIDTLGWYPIEHGAMIIRGRGRVGLSQQPIPASAFVIYDGPGAKGCIVERNYPLIREGVTQVTVQCIGVNADSLWRRTLEFEAIPVLKHTADSIRARLHALWRRSYLASEVDEALHLPTHWPPVTEGLAGADGSIWLRGIPVDGLVTYTVLDDTGESRTTIRIAEGLRILWADATTVWAEERDEDDVPMLSRFAIVEGAVP